MDRSRAVVLGLTLLLMVVSIMLVLPFVQFLLLAVVLAYLLWPLHRRLSSKTGEGISAGILVFAAAVVVIIPVILAARIAIRNVTRIIEGLREGEIDLSGIESLIEERTGQSVDLVARLQTILSESESALLDSAISTVELLTHVAIGLALTMFLLYYFLKDAERFDRWLRATLPMEDHIYEELVDEFDDVMSAVLLSHVLIAIIQGLVAGLGFVIVGLPEPIFWTVVMILLAVLPVIGSFLIWGPASIYLLVTDQPVAGVFLFVYGAIIVGLTDDFLRPLIIERYTTTQLNPSVIILGVVGGAYLLGFIGIFVGPVLIGLLRAVLDVYRREIVENGAETEGS